MLLAPANLLACSCMRASAAQRCGALNNSTAIFVGVVLGKRALPPTAGEMTLLNKMPDRMRQSFLNFRPMQFDFQVVEPFRGTTSQEVTIQTGHGGGDCGYEFEIGKRYLVFAGGTEGSALGTSICTLTQPFSEGSTELKALRRMRDDAANGLVEGTVAKPYYSANGNVYHGAGIPGVDVVLSNKAGTYSARSDTQGDFLLRELLPGTYEVALTNGIRLNDQPKPVKVSAGVCSPFDFDIEAARVVSGQIIGERDSVGGVRVRLIPKSVVADSSRWPEWVDSTDHDGYFKIKEVPAGEYYVAIFANGPPDGFEPYPATFAPGVKNAEEADTVRVDEDGDPAAVQIHFPLELRRSLVLLSTIDPLGRPVPDAEYTFTNLNFPDGEQSLDTCTDSGKEVGKCMSVYEGYKYSIAAKYRGMCSLPDEIDSAKAPDSIMLTLALKCADQH